MVTLELQKFTFFHSLCKVVVNFQFHLLYIPYLVSYLSDELKYDNSIKPIIIMSSRSCTIAFPMLGIPAAWSLSVDQYPTSAAAVIIGAICDSVTYAP